MDSTPVRRDSRDSMVSFKEERDLFITFLTLAHQPEIKSLI